VPAGQAPASCEGGGRALRESTTHDGGSGTATTAGVAHRRDGRRGSRLLRKLAFGSLALVRPGWRFQFARGFGHAERLPRYGFDRNANAAHVT
jgi:hypothetical protein